MTSECSDLIKLSQWQPGTSTVPKILPHKAVSTMNLIFLTNKALWPTEM